MESYQLEHSDIVLRTHEAGVCKGPVCCIHNKSDHWFRKYPQAWWFGKMWRETDEGLVPDPDAFQAMNDDKTMLYEITKHVLIKNAIKCLACNSIIESTNRHDFVSCYCGESSVDGGTDYLRRLGSNWIDLSENKELKLLVPGEWLEDFANVV